MVRAKKSARKNQHGTYTDEQKTSLLRYFFEHVNNPKNTKAHEKFQDVLLQDILPAIAKCRRDISKILSRADTEYYRLSAVEVLASIYKQSKGPEKVPVSTLEKFLKNWLGIVVTNTQSSATWKKAITFLQRGMTDLPDTAQMNQKDADKMQHKIDRILNNVNLELAAANIAAVLLGLFPKNSLNKISIGSYSNYNKLKKKNSFNELMADWDPSWDVDVGEFDVDRTPRDPRAVFT